MRRCGGDRSFLACDPGFGEGLDGIVVARVLETRPVEGANKIELVINPPPDRPIVATVDVTPQPTATPAPTASVAPGKTAPPPTPAPVRTPVDVRILDNPKAYFASEVRNDWCAPAGVQIVLAILGHADTSKAFQTILAGRIGEWESSRDSRNGEWGPAAMVQALAAYVKTLGARAPRS